MSLWSWLVESVLRDASDGLSLTRRRQRGCLAGHCRSWCLFLGPPYSLCSMDSSALEVQDHFLQVLLADSMGLSCCCCNFGFAPVDMGWC